MEKNEKLNLISEQAGRLVEIREYLKMNWAELAASISYSDDALAQIYRQRRNMISAKMARAISEKYQIPFNWILYGTDPSRGVPGYSLGSNVGSVATSCSLCKEKERVISLLEEQVASLKGQLADLVL